MKNIEEFKIEEHENSKTHQQEISATLKAIP